MRRPRGSWPFSVALRASAAGLLLAGCAGSPSRPAEPAPATLSAMPGATVLSVEPWSFHGREGQLIRTQWYRLYTTVDDPDLLDAMPAFLEAALDQYTSVLGPLPRPPLKLDTFLMASRPQWAALTQQVMGQSAGIYLQIQRGGFASGGRALLWSIGRHDTPAIAAHEGWHQYTQRTFGDRLPPWLEEGVATFMEGYHTSASDPAHPQFLPWANVERYDQLRTAAARGELLALDELLGASPQDLIGSDQRGTLTYYAQVWALTHFLNEGEDRRHAEALRRLLSDAAAGTLRNRVRETLRAHGVSHRALPGTIGPAVFAAYFGEDLERAGDAYAAFVARVVAAGSRDRIVQGISPLSP